MKVPFLTCYKNMIYTLLCVRQPCYCYFCSNQRRKSTAQRIVISFQPSIYLCQFWIKELCSGTSSHFLFFPSSRDFQQCFFQLHRHYGSREKSPDVDVPPSHATTSGLDWWFTMKWKSTSVILGFPGLVLSLSCQPLTFLSSHVIAFHFIQHLKSLQHHLWNRRWPTCHVLYIILH